MRIHDVGKLVVLAALATACGSKKEADNRQQESPPKPAAPETATAEKTPAAPKAVFEGPGAFLEKTIGDWQLSGAPRYFGPDNLYDLINGGAEVYTAFGLQKMVTADYKSSAMKDVTVTVEIYDMGSSLGAFGRFARFLAGEASPADAGKGLPEAIAPQGRFGGVSASFYKGKHLVNLTVLDESPTATMESSNKTGEAVLPKIALRLFEKIPDAEPLPTALNRFPKNDLVERSEGYEPGEWAGIDQLCPCFTARYAAEKGAWTLFVTEAKSDAHALDALMTAGRDKPGVTLKKIGDRLVGVIAEDTSGDALKYAKTHLDAFAKALSTP